MIVLWSLVIWVMSLVLPSGDAYWYGEFYDSPRVAASVLLLAWAARITLLYMYRRYEAAAVGNECLGRGYDLRATRGVACPECGAKIADEQRSKLAELALPTAEIAL